MKYKHITLKVEEGLHKVIKVESAKNDMTLVETVMDILNKFYKKDCHDKKK